MHGVHIHLGEQGSGSSDYRRNEDVTGLAKLAYVAGSYEPCDVGREVRPPKVVDDVCSCGKVSVMSSGVMSGSENCRLFVTIDDYFVMTLWIPLPKMAFYLEEIFGIPQESSVCGIGESWRMFGGLEPFVNMLQMVVGMAGSVRLGEKVIGEQWFVGDGIGDVCRGRSRTWDLWFKQIEKMHEPVDLVNPIVELRVFRGVSIFIRRLLWSSGKAVGPCRVPGT